MYDLSVTMHDNNNSICTDIHIAVFCSLQKWSKGKNKDKVNNQVLFDKAGYEKLLAEVPKYKMITPSVLSDRLRVRFSCISEERLCRLIHVALYRMWCL